MKTKRQYLAVCLVLGVVLLVAALLLMPRNSGETAATDETAAADVLVSPETAVQLGAVVVPWNEGGMTDLTARAFLACAAFDVPIINMSGANGANGTNSVFDAPDKTLVFTSLSAFVTSKQLGFSDWRHTEWDIWLVAYAPYMVAVREDSPYRTVGDLAAAQALSATMPNADQADSSVLPPTTPHAARLVCANVGAGTLGFVAAHVFAAENGLDVQHMAYSGSAPAINAVLSGEADFVLAPMSEIEPRSEGLRVLGEADFGEYYGIMSPEGGEGLLGDFDNLSSGEVDEGLLGVDTLPPSGADEGLLQSLDIAWKTAVAEASFATFADNAGLRPLEINREQSALTADTMADVVGWTLYDTGCVNVPPWE